MREETQYEEKLDVREVQSEPHETRAGEMAEGGWEASCRGELMAGEKCRGELSPAGPWASACRTTDHMAGQRGHCRGETGGGWGSCRAELASGPRSHAMVGSGLEPSYEDGVEFTEVSGSYLIWGGSRISKLANVSFGFQRQI